MQRTYESSKSNGEEGNGSAVKNETAARQASLENLARDYGERAFQFACRLSGNADEAQELVQEAMYRVTKNWNRYDGERPLNAWFFTILRNAFLDSPKRSGRKHSVSLDAPFAGDADNGCLGDLLPDDGMDVLERLERQETARAVKKALRGLRKDHRAVLKLRDMDGLSYEAVAQTLGVSVGTIRSRISRARDSFRSGAVRSPGLAF